jgi:hypothetical protein
MTMTLKKVGDRIRADLAAAQKDGRLPCDSPRFGYVRYDVRASQSKKTGPSVNVTITGYEWLVGGEANYRTWMASEGAELLEKVDAIVGRNRWDPAPGGVTKFGVFIITTSATTRTV